MAKTIKQQAEMILTNNGWTYDSTGRSPAWIDPTNRTDHRIYLGSRGSLRSGPNKTESKPFSNLDHMTRWIKAIAKRPPREPAVKLENALTALRRQAHAHIQSMDFDMLKAFMLSTGGYVAPLVRPSGEPITCPYHTNYPASRDQAPMPQANCHRCIAWDQLQGDGSLLYAPTESAHERDACDTAST